MTFSSLTTSVCTVSGSTVTLAALGTCTIAANQPGNATYAAATPVTQSFVITSGSGAGSGGDTDGPIPLWAFAALYIGLVGIASQRLKRAA